MTSLCFNPAELVLAATTTERLVRLYDMESFEVIICIDMMIYMIYGMESLDVIWLGI